MGKEMASYLSFDCPCMHHSRKECGVSCMPERMRPSSGGFGPDGQHGQGSGVWLSERVTEDAGYDTASMGGSGGLCICLVWSVPEACWDDAHAPGREQDFQSRRQGLAWVVLATSKPRQSTRTSVSRYQPSGTRRDGKVCTSMPRSCAAEPQFVKEEKSTVPGAAPHCGGDWGRRSARLAGVFQRSSDRTHAS